MGGVPSRVANRGRPFEPGGPIAFKNCDAMPDDARPADIREPDAVRTLLACELGERLHQGGWRERCEIRLACGVVVPAIDVSIPARDDDRVSLEIGGPASGRVQCDLFWENGKQGKLDAVSLTSFFHTVSIPPAYRDALSERTLQAGHPKLRAPHVFMLLVDELVYWATQKYGMRPGCTMQLEDTVNLDHDIGRTPFALHGRTVFSGCRNSRFLQSKRGYGYYETFGFWPADVDPRDYMLRVSRLTSVGTAPGYSDYAATATQVHGMRFDQMSKTLPPVLPPLAGGVWREFTDMDDYYNRVLVVGSYGQPAELERPPRTRAAPVESMAPPTSIGSKLAALDAAALVDAVHTLGTLPPSTVDGVPAPQGIQVSSVGGVRYVRLGEWFFCIKLHEVLITGPLAYVPQVTRLAELLAAEFASGARITWHFGRHHRERVYVYGTAHESGDGRFMARGTQMLTALGYVPAVAGQLDARPQPDAPALLQEARRADAQFDGEFVDAFHPRFAQLLRIARALGRDRWVRSAPLSRPPPAKRPR